MHRPPTAPHSPLGGNRHEPDEKHRKKFNAALRNAIICLGIGIGLFLIKPFFFGTHTSENGDSTARLLGTLGVALSAYGGFIILCALFLKKQMPLLNLLAFWLVLPAFIIKALMDWQG